MDLKSLIKKNWIIIVGIITGGIAGYLYWHFIGCQGGTCPITSVWYHNTLFGAFAGYLLGDSIKDTVLKKNKEPKQE